MQCQLSERQLLNLIDAYFTNYTQLKMVNDYKISLFNKVYLEFHVIDTGAYSTPDCSKCTKHTILVAKNRISLS